MQRRAFLVAEVVSFDDQHLYFCAIGQVRRLIDGDAAVLHVVLEAALRSHSEPRFDRTEIRVELSERSENSELCELTISQGSGSILSEH